MATVTALHPERRDRVRVELDGAPWRTLPAAAVVAAGLGVGAVLDRPRARELASRAAAQRRRSTRPGGRSRAATGRRPASTRCSSGAASRATERAAAVETLERLGYVDERRFAASRAAALAARGYGDEAIRFDLEREGVDGGGEPRPRSRRSSPSSSVRARSSPAGGDRRRPHAARAARLLARDDRVAAAWSSADRRLEPAAFLGASAGRQDQATASA